jgi:hypothetical protein
MTKLFPEDGISSQMLNREIAQISEHISHAETVLQEGEFHVDFECFNQIQQMCQERSSYYKECQ